MNKIRIVNPPPRLHGYIISPDILYENMYLIDYITYNNIV